MAEKKLGTVGGKPINQNMLDDYAETFAKDWSDTEMTFAHTERRRGLNASGTCGFGRVCVDGSVFEGSEVSWEW